MLTLRLVRHLLLGCLLTASVGFTTSNSVSASTDSALACSFWVMEPEHNGGLVYVEGGSSGCGNGEDFRLQLQWRIWTDGWYTKATQRWTGNSSFEAAVFDCMNGEIETYRGKITRLDTVQNKYSEDTVRIKC